MTEIHSSVHYTVGKQNRRNIYFGLCQKAIYFLFWNWCYSRHSGLLLDCSRLFCIQFYNQIKFSTYMLWNSNRYKVFWRWRCLSCRERERTLFRFLSYRRVRDYLYPTMLTIFRLLNILGIWHVTPSCIKSGLWMTAVDLEA